MNLVIPGLPDELRVVPAGPDGPDDPFRADRIDEWIEWGQKVVDHRRFRWMACEGLIEGLQPEREQEIERLTCSLSPIYCVTMFMHIYETDPERLKRYPWHRKEHGGWLPAVPFPYMVRLFRWLDARLSSEKTPNGMIGKPRRMGMTDWTVNWALAHWLFDQPFSAKFVSRNQSLVYDKGNMDAILQRAIAKLSDAPGNAPVPGWMLPREWDEGAHVSELKIMRPDNKNLIGGEATTGTAGRGGRATVAFIDEAAFIRDLGMILGNVQATAPHVIALSSESVEVSREFVDIKESLENTDPEAVFNMDWWEHPFQDRAWLENERARYEKQGRLHAFAREILREPHAGFDGWMYQDAQNVTVLAENVDPLEHPHGSIVVGIDPGWSDETAIHWMLLDPICGHDTVLESMEARAMPAEFYAAIIAGCDPDDFPEFHFPPYLRDLMEWTRSLPTPRMVCGDPYGYQQRAGRDDSWYARMIRFWEQYNPKIDPQTNRPLVYPIVANWKMDARSLQGRRLSMMHWLRDRNMDGSSRLQFNDTPDVRQTLLALQRSKWQEETDRRITEAKDIYHDEHSHRRSAMEYIAVNREEMLWTAAARPDARTAPKRQQSFAQRSAA